MSRLLRLAGMRTSAVAVPEGPVDLLVQVAHASTVRPARARVPGAASPDSLRR